MHRRRPLHPAAPRSTCFPWQAALLAAGPPFGLSADCIGRHGGRRAACSVGFAARRALDKGVWRRRLLPQVQRGDRYTLTVCRAAQPPPPPPPRRRHRCPTAADPAGHSTGTAAWRLSAAAGHSSSAPLRCCCTCSRRSCPAQRPVCAPFVRGSCAAGCAMCAA